MRRPTTSRAVIALNRFGLGARPGEIETATGDPRRWLRDQIVGPARTPPDLVRLPDSASILAEVQQQREARRAARRQGGDAASKLPKMGKLLREHYLAQGIARYRVAAASEHPFHERLVHFWSNHFAVSADKQPVSALAGTFENEAIRPRVNGRFVDLLLAVERHPAMLVYLDNVRSVGPNSEMGKRAKQRVRKREFGLNENLAREILELHTLGVNGGYDQADVTAFARVLTGWSVGGGRGPMKAGTPGRFHFRSNVHEPGPQRILGERYPDAGAAQGETVLRGLAAHPSTARHLATKLARHFVSDAPPPGLVDTLARTYLESAGDLASVYGALIDAEAAWTAPAVKLKSPHDLVVSTYRAFEHRPDRPRRAIGALATLGQPPYRPGSPAGWPDTAEHWGSADALFKRIEWAAALARLAGPRTDPLALADSILGASLGEHTRTALARAESAAQGLTLLLASPEFQRR